MPIARTYVRIVWEDPGAVAGCRIWFQPTWPEAARAAVAGRKQGDTRIVLEEVTFHAPVS